MNDFLMDGWIDIVFWMDWMEIDWERWALNPQDDRLLTRFYLT